MPFFGFKSHINFHKKSIKIIGFNLYQKNNIHNNDIQCIINANVDKLFEMIYIPLYIYIIIKQGIKLESEFQILQELKGEKNDGKTKNQKELKLNKKKIKLYIDKEKEENKREKAKETKAKTTEPKNENKASTSFKNK